VNGLLKCACITHDGMTDVAQFGFTAEVVTEVQASVECEGRYSTTHNQNPEIPFRASSVIDAV